MSRRRNKREEYQEQERYLEEDEYEEYDEYEEDEYEEYPEYDEYDEQAEDEELPDEEYEEAYDEEAYDEDVFSLEEELKRERRRQWVAYLFFAILAAALIAGALWGSVVLTNRRLALQSTIEIAPNEEDEEQPVQGEIAPAGDEAPVQPEKQALSHWPKDLYPSIPAVESAAYETTVEPGYVQVVVPSQTARNFDAYIDTLVEEGAALRVRSTRLSVLVLDGVEIHLVNNNLETKVVLCSEDTIIWNDSGYSAFPLPKAGRLVSVREGVGAGSRVLVYRMASTVDALDYVTKLMDDGWVISGSMEPVGNQLSATLKKNNLQITVDYFSTGDNYQLRLDYLN